MGERVPICVHGPKTILIIEDEASVARAVARLLGRDGYTVEMAANGHLGLDKALVNAYDLILCDLRMPVLDGIAFYHALAYRLPALCQRVVFLTGASLDQEAMAFLAQVGRPWLLKPFSMEDLRHIIDNVIASQT